MDFMGGSSVKLFVVILLIGYSFSQDYDYPTYAEDDLPETSFSCKEKFHGGYYADIETGCQMYHICMRDKFGVMRSTKFLCGNGTVFDQRHQVCQDYRKVLWCQDSAKYYRKRAHKYMQTEERKQLQDQEFLQVLDYPTYSEYNLPITRFSCEDKTNGGHYADIETNCQMYHICSKDKFGYMRSTRFLCGNGTVFDQRQLVCEDYRLVLWCKESEKYFKQRRYG